MTEPADFDLSFSYDAFPRIEEDFAAALDVSLAPRGPEMMMDLVGSYPLGPEHLALDVGCGEGGHSLGLARQTGVCVLGLDPVRRHIEVARASLSAQPAAGEGPWISFVVGVAEQLPVRTGSIDFVWCRDVLVHVRELDLALREMRRVMRPGARALIYLMLATDLLEPGEAQRLFGPLGVVPASTDAGILEAAIAQAGLAITDRFEVGTEWGEHAQETTGKPARLLLHAARLTRTKERYVEQFGEAVYDLKLSDALWHIYAMIGKLTRRIYCLQAG